MNNFELLKQTLDKIGLTYKVGTPENKLDSYTYKYGPDCDYQILIDEGQGYADFSCVFNFDSQGKFISHSCFE